MPEQGPEGKLGWLDNISIFYYREMGQDKSSLHLTMLKHLLKMQGIHISQSGLEMCLDTEREYDPWIPDKGFIDSDI